MVRRLENTITPRQLLETDPENMLQALNILYNVRSHLSFLQSHLSIQREVMIHVHAIHRYL